MQLGDCYGAKCAGDRREIEEGRVTLFQLIYHALNEQSV